MELPVCAEVLLVRPADMLHVIPTCGFWCNTFGSDTVIFFTGCANVDFCLWRLFPLMKVTMWPYLNRSYTSQWFVFHLRVWFYCVFTADHIFDVEMTHEAASVSDNMSPTCLPYKVWFKNDNETAPFFPHYIIFFNTILKHVTVSLIFSNSTCTVFCTVHCQLVLKRCG